MGHMINMGENVINDIFLFQHLPYFVCVCVGGGGAGTKRLKMVCVYNVIQNLIPKLNSQTAKMTSREIFFLFFYSLPLKSP